MTYQDLLALDRHIASLTAPADRQEAQEIRRILFRRVVAGWYISDEDTRRAQHYIITHRLRAAQ